MSGANLNKFPNIKVKKDWGEMDLLPCDQCGTNRWHRYGKGGKNCQTCGTETLNRVGSDGKPVPPLRILRDRGRASYSPERKVERVAAANLPVNFQPDHSCLASIIYFVVMISMVLGIVYLMEVNGWLAIIRAAILP